MCNFDTAIILNIEIFMIPVSLTLQGIYSYKKKQTIDFTRLTKAGLFGIFGVTGSGKSAIIEAISYALYGETERMNTRGDERSYNMMNLQSNQLLIDFICIAESNNTRYRFIVEGKRNKKDFTKVPAYTHSVYIEQNSEWIPTKKTDVTQQLTGLSYEHFKRTVIIPQGRFMEFLHLLPTERTKMLKDIFSLHSFDLYDKTKSLLNKTKEERAVLEGQLQGIGEVSADELQQKKLYVAELETKNETAQTQKNSLSKEIETLLRIADDVTELQLLQKKNEELISAADTFSAVETRIATIQLACKKFEVMLRNREQKQKEHTHFKEIVESKTKELERKQIDFEEKRKQFFTIKSEFENLAEFEKTTNAIKECIEIASNTKELTHALNRQKEGTICVDKVEKKLSEITAVVSQLQIAIAEKKQTQGDIAYLTQQKIHSQTYLAIIKQIEEQRVERVTAEKNISKFTKEIANILAEYGVTKDVLTFDYIPFFTKIQEDLDTQKKEHEFALQTAKVQEELILLQEKLETGTPCPLCGATEHPNKHTQLKHNAKDTSTHTTAIENIETKLLGVQEKKQQLFILYRDIVTEKERDATASDKMHELTIARNLAEPDEKIEDIDAKIAHYTTTQKEIESLEKQVKNTEDEQKKLEKNRAKYTDEMLKITNSISRFQTAIEIHSKKCSKEILDAYSTQSVEKLEENVVEREHKAQQCTMLYHKQLKEYEDAQKQLHELTASRNTIIQQYIKIEQDYGVLQKEIETALQESSFSSLQEVESFVKQSHTIIEDTKKLEQYKHACATTREHIQKISQKLSGISFDKAVLEKKQVEYKEIEQTAQQTQKLLIQEKQLFQQYTERIQKQKDVMEKIESVSYRIENLQTLLKLFASQGFVNYMSTKYLHLLCSIANKRFKVLTKHTLQLEVDDTNAFKVRDLLNNGHVRHIKTLSGGQTFQAALSLALALSEIIQTENPAASNFFFIDEGFGSQDKDSLQLVFETLQNLQKEGKIVGVISHVDELKEYIPVHVSVVASEEGSVIHL